MSGPAMETGKRRYMYMWLTLSLNISVTALTGEFLGQLHTRAVQVAQMKVGLSFSPSYLVDSPQGKQSPWDWIGSEILFRHGCHVCVSDGNRFITEYLAESNPEPFILYMYSSTRCSS